eukprot:gene6678-7994_t
MAREQQCPDTQSCTPCPIGWVKFTNGTEQCESCEGRGVVCHGGADFETEDDHWLAVDSAFECCRALEAECILDRVYSCLDEDSCRSISGAIAMEDKEYAQFTQCEDGHDPAVVLCGRCLAGYEGNSMGRLGMRCTACPRENDVQGLILLALRAAGFVGLILLLVYILWKIYKQVNHHSFFDSIKKTNAASATHATGGMVSGSILIAWIQVSSQTIDVWPEYMMPSMYRKSLKFTSVLNFHLVEIFSLPCIMFAIVGTQQWTVWVDSFYMQLLFSALLPLAIAAPLLRTLVVNIRAKGCAPWVLADDALLPNSRYEARRLFSVSQLSSCCWSTSDSITSNRRPSATLVRMSEIKSDRNAELSSLPPSDSLPMSHQPAIEFGNQGTAVQTSEADKGEHEGGESLRLATFEEGYLDKIASTSSFKRTQSTEVTLNPLYPIETAEGSAPFDEHRQRTTAPPEEAGVQKEGPQLSRLMGDSFAEGTAVDDRAMKLPTSPSFTEIDDAASNGNAGDQRDKENAEEEAVGRGSRGPDREDSVAALIFFLILVHTSVSTRMFQIFHCTKVYNDGGQEVSWLLCDLRAQCHTRVWYTFVVLSACVLIFYVFGMPLFFLLAAWQLRKQKQVRLQSGQLAYAMERQLEQRSGQWYYFPCDKGACLLPVRIFPCFHDDAKAKEASKRSKVSRCNEEEQELKQEGRVQFGLTSVHSSCSTMAEEEEEEEEEEGVEGGLDRVLNGLDDPLVQKFFGSFYLSYKPEFFWYTGYDMLRRICQTSLVVIVRLWNPDVDVIYAMFVAFTAAIIHAYMQPYREALGSQLQAAILYNFCCEQLMLFTSKLMPKDGGLVTTLTFCLVAFQLVL